MKNRFKNLLYSTILLSGILSLTIHLMVNSTDAMSFDSFYSQVNENHQKLLWKFGDNLNEGDYFSYRICNSAILKLSSLHIVILYI